MVIDELAKVDQALVAMPAVGVGQLTSASVNGKSFTWADPGGGSGADTSSLGSLTRKKNILLSALAWFDGIPGPCNTTTVALK